MLYKINMGSYISQNQELIPANNKKVVYIFKDDKDIRKINRHKYDMNRKLKLRKKIEKDKINRQKNIKKKRDQWKPHKIKGIPLYQEEFCDYLLDKSNSINENDLEMIEKMNNKQKCILYNLFRTTDNKRNGCIFENTCSKLFEHLGYKVMNTGAKINKSLGDGGKDLVMYKKNKKYVVQCKNHYKNNGADSLHKIVGVANGENAEFAICVNTSEWTKTAKEYKYKLNKNSNSKIKLITYDIHWIIKMIYKYL